MHTFLAGVKQSNTLSSCFSSHTEVFQRIEVVGSSAMCSKKLDVVLVA